MVTRCIPLILLVGLIAAGGCSKPDGPIFQSGLGSTVWPKPPDRARIRYVGQLAGEQSLNKGHSSWEGLGRVFRGPSPVTGFTTPVGAAARGDQVYIADSQSPAVYLMNLGSRAFKPIRDGGGEALAWPMDVEVMNDEVAVADGQRAEVLVYSAAGEYRRSMGRGALKRPASLAWDAANGRLFVVDSAAHGVVAFDASGRELWRRTARGTGPGEFNFPSGVAFKSNVGLVIADSMNARVQILSPTGEPIRTFGRKGDAAGNFSLPRGVAIDSQDHIYVLDSQFENVQIFNVEGQLLMAFGQEGRGSGEFHLPAGITIDEQDRIWIADAYNRRVQIFQYLAERSNETN